MLSIIRVLQHKIDGNLKANAQTSIGKKFAFWLQGCTPPPSADPFPLNRKRQSVHNFAPACLEALVLTGPLCKHGCCC